MLEQTKNNQVETTTKLNALVEKVESLKDGATKQEMAELLQLAKDVKQSDQAMEDRLDAAQSVLNPTVNTEPTPEPEPTPAPVEPEPAPVEGETEGGENA